MKKISKYNVYRYITKYENDTLREEDIILLFQYLIDSNMIRGLQGHYGIVAECLINRGYCKRRINSGENL